MSFDASSKRQRVEKAEVSETVLDETTYVYQLLRVFGYEDVTKQILDTLCNLTKDWIRVITQPLIISGKEYYPFNVSFSYDDFFVVLATNLSFLLDSLLSLFQGKEIVLEGRHHSGTRKWKEIHHSQE